MKQTESYDLLFLSLKLGIHHFEWTLETDFLESRGVEDLKIKDMTCAFDVNKRERIMELDFRISGQIETSCDRCAEDLTFGFNTTNHLIVKFAEESDFTDDEVVFLSDKEYKIDLSQFIYEFVLMGLPAKRIHPEGECNSDVEEYLQEVEETEESEIDPRWEALNKLKN